MASELKTNGIGKSGDAYQALMQLWQSQYYAPEVTPLTFQIELTADPVWQQLAHTGPGLTWILDVRTGTYLFMSHTSKWFTGLPSELFLQEGITRMKTLLHPADADNYWKLKRRVWNILLALSPQERGQYQFSCDYRIR